MKQTRKIIIGAGVLAVLLLVGLVSCQSAKNTPDTGSNPGTEAIETEQPTKNAAPTTEATQNGKTETEPTTEGVSASTEPVPETAGTEEPGTDAAATTEPKPTEPKPTEPKPTEPKPTEPAPTQPANPIEQARNCIGKSVNELYKLIGKPNAASYAPSCEDPDAEDGLLEYNGFTVWTLRYANGNEVVYDVFD